MSEPVRILTAPMLDPGQARTQHEVPAGLTLEDIVAQTLPGLGRSDWANLRVMLVSVEGTAVIEAANWSRVRPKEGVQVVIRLVPGKDGLRSILLAVVSVAAMALVGPVAGLLGVTGKFGTGLVAAGLSVTGAILVNALVPLSAPDPESRKKSYSISGWQNDVRPGEPLPDIAGQIRYAPPFAAPSFTEIVGDDQYVRALFCFGYGPLDISDIRIGDTPIDEYDGVELELREGRAGDLPLTLYPHQVLEDAEGPELTRPWPTDDAGDAVAGPGIETPIVRRTAENTQIVSAILTFPAGLYAVDDKGRELAALVDIRIRMRPVGDLVWQDVTTLPVYALNRAAFHRQHSWQLPARGKWEIEVTRMTDEVDSSSRSDRVTLSALQSIRPEYPLNLDVPVSLLALRVKASHQLNSALDNVNGLVRRYARVWDGDSWIEGLPRNPASAYLNLLQGASNPYPVSDAGIDLDEIADWFTWCEAKGLKYDAAQDEAQSLGERLRQICAAGRATPRHDGVQWGVVIDRPTDLIIDHLSPRNASGFNWQRDYFEPPHAFRVNFLDETNDYAPAERIVPWPDFDGDITLTEEIALPGKTDPNEIWIEARRRMYELIYRPDTFQAVQDGMARSVTRGDQVAASFDVLSRQQLSARVIGVEGRLVALDVDLGDLSGALGIRFRQFLNDADLVGTSIVRPIETVVHRAVLLGEGLMPEPGDLVHFGPIDTVSKSLRVRAIEGGQNMSQVLDMVAAAPEIDTLTDAEIPPVWSGRVGSPLVTGSLTPPAPRFTKVHSQALYTARPEPDMEPEPAETVLSVLVAPGDSSVFLSAIRLYHRLQGEPVWSEIDLPPAAGGTKIDGYETGDAVELKLTAIALDDTESAESPTVTTTIGGGAVLPSQIDAASVEISGDLGHTKISLAMPTGADLVRVYRVPFGFTIDRDVHEVGFTLSGAPGQTLTAIDGDGTRRNLLDDPGLDVPGSWSIGTDWSIAGGVASHANGLESDLGQAIALQSGVTYRAGFDLRTRSAGSVRAALTGGTAVLGAPVTTLGLHSVSLTAQAGNTHFALRASADLAAEVDDLSLFVETAACLDAGSYNYFLQSETDGGIPGALTGPFPVTIK